MILSGARFTKKPAWPRALASSGFVKLSEAAGGFGASRGARTGRTRTRRGCRVSGRERRDELETPPGGHDLVRRGRARGPWPRPRLPWTGEAETPHFAHAAAHATDGVHKFADGVRKFSVWRARPSRSSLGPVSRALLLAKTGKRRARRRPRQRQRWQRRGGRRSQAATGVRT